MWNGSKGEKWLVTQEKEKKEEKSKIFVGDGRTLYGNFVIVHVDVYVLVTKTYSLFKK